MLSMVHYEWRFDGLPVPGQSGNNFDAPLCAILTVPA